MIRLTTSLAALAMALAVAPVSAQTAPTTPAKALTAQDADAFIASAEAQLAPLSVDVNRISWVNATFITDDTDALAAQAGARQTILQVQLATEAAKYASVPGLSFDTKRKIDLLRSGITLPAPARAGAADELATIVTRMSSEYGKGRGTLDGKPINGSDIEAAMGTVRDPARLQEMWTSWHDNVGAQMRGDYARQVTIANEGARELGYADTGALWRAGYDMTPDQFAAMTDKLWKQVEPLYLALHTYVRWKLNEKYGDGVQPKTGPIRADLLGNMWGQEWGNIYDLVAPPGAGDLGFDTGALLQAKGYDPVKMVKAGEGFYSSLDFPQLPASFWERSQITKPRDREVICHASAWDIDNQDDIRVKTCLKINADDFVTIHHELGHNYYQRAYKGQSFLYENGANDGFHEAIGDFVALSITPNYLVQIGLLDPAKGGGAWTPLGPLHGEGLFNQFRDRSVYNAGTANFGGRTIAAEIDPNCVAGDCRLWIANANGGVWQTDDALAGEPIAIDGYNLLITIESALSGGIILAGRDGCLRDLASLHGTYRTVEETLPAARLIGEHLHALHPASIDWYVDAPVSNSGRLRALLLEESAREGWGWSITLDNNPDKVLAASSAIVVSSDSWVIDHAGRWTNLADALLRERLPGAAIVRMG